MWQRYILMSLSSQPVIAANPHCHLCSCRVVIVALASIVFPVPGPPIIATLWPVIASSWVTSIVLVNNSHCTKGLSLMLEANEKVVLVQVLIYIAWLSENQIKLPGPTVIRKINEYMSLLWNQHIHWYQFGMIGYILEVWLEIILINTYFFSLWVDLYIWQTWFAKPRTFSKNDIFFTNSGQKCLILIKCYMYRHKCSSSEK